MRYHITLVIACIGLMASNLSNWHSQAGPIYLRVNQVGYLPNESKHAFAVTNQPLIDQTFSIVREADGKPLFNGSVGDDRGASGTFAHVYELDFSELSVEGKYHLSLGSDKSVVFLIDANAYAGLMSQTLSFFRVQRSGQTDPMLHGPSHLKDGIAQGGPANGTAIDLTGGWYDAGDYLKFVATQGFVLPVMLTAYLRHPEVFVDSNRNKLPDVLDESRIGLDWLLKTWDPVNHVLYYQVGDKSDHNVGWRMPESDDAKLPPRPVFACDPGKGANVAGKAAAALALAASIWNDPSRPYYDAGLASRYLNAAEQIYAYGKARPAVQSSRDGFYEEDTWQDKMALAAAELFRATHDPTYQDEARNYATLAGHVGLFNWSSMHALAHYELARLDPTYLSTASATLQADLASFQADADGNTFRASIQDFYWGSAGVLVGAALTALWYEDLTGDDQFHALAIAQRDYILGRNPWGVSFVNSAGTIWPRRPHHQVANLTGSELIGFWDEGPIAKADFDREGIKLKYRDNYADFQSDMAVYHDDPADYVTNEPTITMNGAGVALLAWFAPPVANLP